MSRGAGEPRWAHEFVQHFARRLLPGEMAGPDAHVIFAIEEWLEIGKADNVVIMAVGKEHIDVPDALCLQGLTGG